MEEITMKTKKIFAAAAASVMAVSMLACTAFAQGKTEDPDEIQTTPVETEVITAAPEETTAPATEAAPAETTAVAPVDNIPTGNAPVALAVIPVALAAAAIVAKKANK